MRKLAKRFHSGEKGFTLIELLIVIAILGILAAVIIPNVTSFIARGHVSAANAELAQVGTAGQAGAASQSGGQFANGFLLTDTSLNAGDVAAAGALKPYITGKLKGEYWIDTTGAVTLTAAAYALHTPLVAPAGTAGDPWSLGVYFDITQAQFVGNVAGKGGVPLTDTVLAVGDITNQPSLH